MSIWYAPLWGSRFQPELPVPFLKNVRSPVFIIAQVLGVFSQVPGGLGVFEGLFMYIIPGEHNQALLFGALIAYRIIYYLMPLVVSGIILILYESYLRFVKKQRLEKLKIFRADKIDKINPV